MTVLAILLIVVCAAVALLLACLKGFTGALRLKNTVPVMFVSREGPAVPMPQGPSKTLIDFSRRKTPPSKDPAIQRISNGTVALVGVAIALGSRAVDGRARAGSSDPKGVESGHRAGTQLPGMQPRGQSR